MINSNIRNYISNVLYTRLDFLFFEKYSIPSHDSSAVEANKNEINLLMESLACIVGCINYDLVNQIERKYYHD